MSDRGSVSVLILGIVAWLVVLGVMLVTLGHFLTVRSEVQAAADAAALAAAPVTFHPFGSQGNPAAEAARLAIANGTRLARCLCPIDRSWASRVVEVLVIREVDLAVLGRREIRAVAAAEFAPVELLIHGQMDAKRISYGK
jgi:secretion/DNA translocation related TadE-like protein